VHGNSGEYLTLARTYCSCQAHYYEVVAKSEAPYVSLQPQISIFQACTCNLLLLLQHCQLHQPAVDFHSTSLVSLGAMLTCIGNLKRYQLEPCQPSPCFVCRVSLCSADHCRHDARLSALQCKHQLAARLALILKQCPIITVSDAVLAQHLLKV
jgi:hypothetical protein